MALMIRSAGIRVIISSLCGETGVWQDPFIHRKIKALRSFASIAVTVTGRPLGFFEVVLEDVPKNEFLFAPNAIGLLGRKRGKNALELFLAFGRGIRLCVVFPARPPALLAAILVASLK